MRDRVEPTKSTIHCILSSMLAKSPRLFNTSLCQCHLNQPDWSLTLGQNLSFVPNISSQVIGAILVRKWNYSPCFHNVSVCFYYKICYIWKRIFFFLGAQTLIYIIYKWMSRNYAHSTVLRIPISQNIM